MLSLIFLKHSTQAPRLVPIPPRMVGGGFPQNSFNQRDQDIPRDRPSGIPPGYGDPNFGEDQVKNFLKNQRKEQQNPNEFDTLPNERNPPEWKPSTDDWSGPSIPAGPNAFSTLPPKLGTDAMSNQRSTNVDKTDGGQSPARESTPTPEDNMDFGEESAADSKQETSEETLISQRKVYEELQRKQKEKEMRLEPVKEPNPMFKEDNWYSSDEESEEKEEHLKRKSPEKKVDKKEDENSRNVNSLKQQTQTVTTTILSLKETPVTPPPPTLSASDRDTMEASISSNERVQLPRELTKVLSAIQNTPTSSTSFESNTSSPISGSRDPR